MLTSANSILIREDLSGPIENGAVFEVVIEGQTKHACDGVQASRLAHGYARDNWSPFARQSFTRSETAKLINQDIVSSEPRYQRRIGFLRVEP